jgi:Bacterial pre-peptidase C-terminal domain
MNAKLLRAQAGMVIALVAGACWAAPPSIESLSMPILQFGQATQLEIVGAGMNQVREVLFYSAGLRCLKIDHLDDYKLLATFEAQTDSAIKSHAFRLRGDDGFSELRTIRVSRFPIIREEPRASVETVIDLAYKNQTIAGTLQSGDYDRYAIKLEKGQRLTVEAEAMRLGGTLLDTVLKIYDPRGKLLQTSDDDSLLHQDPTLSLIAPENGRYIVELHESNYSGSANSHYALHVGSFPATRVAYPAGGQLGTEVQLSFLAVGQSKADLFSQTITLPADDREFQLFASQGEVKSASPIPFRLSSFPNVLEQEPNQTIEAGSRSNRAPIAFNGILQAAADVDSFTFDAEQGQSLKIEVYADRIGSPIDSYLQLYDAAGQLLAVNDDCDSNDSRIEFEAPEHGRYILQIRDKLYRGSSSGVYRIEVSPNMPRLTTFLPRPERTSQRQQTIAVPQGNRTLTKVAVKRENIDGEIQLRFIDLPQGVRSTPVYIPANEYWAIAILEADAGAEVAGALSGLVATTQTNDQLITGSFEQTVDLIAESADRLYQAAQVDRVAVAVTPSMPFSIEVQQPRANLAIDGTIDCQIRLNRTAEFGNPVRVEFPYLPDGCVGEPFIVIDRGMNQATYRITATKQTAAGDFKLAAIATVSLVEGRVRGNAPADRQTPERDSPKQTNWNDLRDREVASNLVDLRVDSNPVRGEFFNLAAQRGQSIQVECVLRFIDLVPAKMSCQLEGLPRGVTAQPISLDSGQTQASFELKIAEDAPIGTFPGIQCRLTGSLDGSEVSFVVPSASDLIIAEPGKLMKATDGRVLSPLEALRKKNEK